MVSLFVSPVVTGAAKYPPASVSMTTWVPLLDAIHSQKDGMLKAEFK